MYTAPGRPHRCPCCHTVAIPSSLFPRLPPLSDPDRPRPRSPNCSIYIGIAPFVAPILLTRVSPLLYRSQGVKRISVPHNDNPGTGSLVLLFSPEKGRRVTVTNAKPAGVPQASQQQYQDGSVRSHYRSWSPHRLIQGQSSSRSRSPCGCRSRDYRPR